MNNQDFLTLNKQEGNYEQKRALKLNPELIDPELIDLIRSGQAVLFVGAGSSKRVGYPDWPDLLKKLKDLAGKFGNGFRPSEKYPEDELLEYAEDIKLHISKQMNDLSGYYAFLKRSFEPRSFSPSELQFHKTLVALPFKGILTTNYDVVLEEALTDLNRPSAYKNSFVVNKNMAGQVDSFFLAMNAPDDLAIAHLHGKYDDPTNIILSREDYEEAYNGFVVSKETSGSKNSLELPFLKLLKPRSANQVPRNPEWTLHRKLLWAVLATCRVVFIGFSMKDPYFKKMLETVAKDLWRGSKPVHFAIRGVSPESNEVLKAREEAEKLKKDCGVETLFYEDINGDHQGLADIVYNIAAECGIEPPPVIMPRDQQGDSDPSDDEQMTASDSVNKLDRLKQMSRRMTRRIGDAD